MTDEQLRKALAKALCRAAYPADRFPNLNVDEQATDPHWSEQADAAIALMRPVIRAQALEEAARVVARHYETLCAEHRLLLVNRAAAIRALIPSGVEPSQKDG